MGIPVGINIIKWSNSNEGTLEDDSNVQLTPELQASQEEIDKEVEAYKPTSGKGKSGKKLNLQVEQEQLKEKAKQEKIEDKEEKDSTKEKKEKEDKGIERE